MTCQVEVLLHELDAQTLSVPVATVFSQQDENYVWLVTDGEPVRRVVKTGLLSQTRVQILEGLNEGDVLLLTEPKGTPMADPVDPAAKTKPQPTTQPTTAPASQPTTEPASQPTTETTTQPAAETAESQ
jgi:hypothetical protein